VIKLLIFFSFVFFDLFSKLLIKNNFNLNQSIEINGYLDLVYVQNYGVSFGILSGTVSHWFLILIGLMIVLLLIYLIITSKKILEKLAYFIIIIGAISNILDRSINTFVVDFILIHYKNFYWPAFNFADIYITIGIIMLVTSFFIKSKETK
tara:strand:+ start:1110 stop:1562 length:453 start_codon:yes stop_codon:yes gene_type:complete